MSEKHWRDDAACLGMETDIFFPPRESTHEGESHPYDAARKACAGCPVRAYCLHAGMDEPYGMWGGTTPQEREQLRRKRYRKKGIPA